MKFLDAELDLLKNKILLDLSDFTEKQLYDYVETNYSALQHWKYRTPWNEVAEALNVDSNKIQEIYRKVGRRNRKH